MLTCCAVPAADDAALVTPSTATDPPLLLVLPPAAAAAAAPVPPEPVAWPPADEAEADMPRDRKAAHLQYAKPAHGKDEFNGVQDSG